MVKRCCVNFCKSEAYPGCGISFFSFPRNENLRQQWLEVVTLKNKYSSNSFICSRHFNPEDIIVHQVKSILKPNSIPIYPFGPDAERGQSISVKREAREDGLQASQIHELLSTPVQPRGTRLTCAAITVTSGSSPRFEVKRPLQQSPAFMTAEMKDEADEALSGDDALSCDEEPDQVDDSQPTEDLVPLSVHPVPLSNAPDPLSDVQVKKEEEEGAADERGGDEAWAVREEGRTARVRPQLVVNGEQRVVQSAVEIMNNQFQIRKQEQKIQNLTRQRDQLRLQVRKMREMIRRRDAKILKLQALVGLGGTGAARLAGLSSTGAARHAGLGSTGTARLAGLSSTGAARHAGLGSTGTARLAGLSSTGAARHAGLGSTGTARLAGLSSTGAARHAGLGSTGAARGKRRAEGAATCGGADIKQVQSVNPNERKKKANRVLYVIKGADRPKSAIRHKSAQSTSQIRQMSVQDDADISQQSLIGVLDTSAIRQLAVKNPSETPDSVIPQNSVNVKQNLDIRRNPSLVIQPITDIPKKPSTGTKRKLIVVKAKSVGSQTNKCKSNIRQNSSIVTHPMLDIPQKVASDIPQKSAGLQCPSDIRQNGLVIQIDGMQSTVTQPKLVRLENMDLG